MAFRIAPLAWNLLTAANITTAAAAFRPGFPVGSVVTDDPLEVAIGSGLWVVTANVNDDVCFDEGGAELIGTIAPGIYNGWMAYAIGVATAMNAVGSNWQAYQIQGSTNRGKWELGRTSGTGALRCQNGTSTFTAWRDLGFNEDADRSAAASHTGDVPAVHGTGGEQVAADLTTAQSAQMAAIVHPISGRGLAPVVNFGTTSAVADATETDWGDYDDELMVCFFASPHTYRYVRFDLPSQHAASLPEVGAGILFLGPYFELENSYEWDSKAHGNQLKLTGPTGISGTPFLSELRAGEVFRVEWRAAPGWGDADTGAMRNLLEDLGVNALAIVSFDQSVGRKNTETRLCRLVQMPQMPHSYGRDRSGAWKGITLDWEVKGVL
jgi:hypothetical protein